MEATAAEVKQTNEGYTMIEKAVLNLHKGQLSTDSYIKCSWKNGNYDLYSQPYPIAQSK